MKFTPTEIETISNEFKSATPQEILAWAMENFSPNLAISSSFQTQSMPLLHMVKELNPEMQIFFLDTGMHFWDTLFFREHLEQIWNLNIIDLRPDEKWRTVLRHFGSDLPQTDPNLCCYIRKVQPMQNAMDNLDAWVTGIRRDQTENRAHAKILEYQRDGLLRVAPLLNWSANQIWDYIAEHNLPTHPLPYSQYPSIGCKPCTRAIQLGENERAGRWTGKSKTECGLHTDMFNQDVTESGFKVNLNTGD